MKGHLRRRNGPFADRAEDFVTDPCPQSALRDWRDHIRHRATLTVLTGLAAVLALAGPFGTDDLLRPVPRFAYWLALAAVTYSVGFFATRTVRHGPGRRLPDPRALVLATLLTGAGVTVTVLALNAAILGELPAARDLPAFAGRVFGIACVVTLVLHVVQRHLDAGAASRAPGRKAAPPPILDRLPLDKRGALVALSVEDHYVRVRTDTGEEMVLMRLADAIRETGDTPGLRCHRSHWVALGQVTAARRAGDRAILTMRHGPEIPVSRANLPAVKEAGLLPG